LRWVNVSKPINQLIPAIFAFRPEYFEVRAN
jgi:hypothetical protein